MEFSRLLFKMLPRSGLMVCLLSTSASHLLPLLTTPATDIDKSRSTRPTGNRLGGSLFGSASAVPPELQPLVQPLSTLSRAEAVARPLLKTANTEYTNMSDPATPVPTPPVHAARLSSLLKNLASAEGAVTESMKARKELIAGLEKLLESNKTNLAQDEAIATDLSSRREATESKKKAVEDGIMRGLSAETFNAPLQSNGSTPNDADARSPEIESLTPPPPDMESFTPTGSPRALSEPEPPFPADEHAHQVDFLETDTYAADPIQEQQPTHNELPPAFEPPPAMTSSATSAADSLLRSLALPPQIQQRNHTPPTNGALMDPRLKRRKMSHKSADIDEELFSGNNGVVIDDEVAAMLGAQ